jgi:dTMP kinase
MDNARGTFIVIEGSDGSGKTTQFNILAEELASVGYEVVTLKFPQYSEPSSYFVREYLGGGYGNAEDVGPYTASLFYALDRFAAAKTIRDALAQGKIVLTDRYVGANMAHQGTKFRSAEERRGFFIWLDNLEFEMLRIPRPDATLVLRVPVAVSQKLLDKTGKTRDVHEQSADHLEKAVEVYDDLTQLFPKDFMRLDCTREGELLDIDTIRKLVWQKVAPLLAPLKSPTPKPIETHETKATAENIPKQAELVAEAKSKDHDLLRTGKQHHGAVQFVVEGASDLLVAKIERSQGASYTEQSTTSYETKRGDNWRYFTPKQFDETLTKQYRAHMDEIFELHASIVAKLQAYLNETSIIPEAKRSDEWDALTLREARTAARAMLPTAATTSVAVFTSNQNIESFVARLLGDELPEARAAAENLLHEMRKVSANFLEGGDKNAKVLYRAETKASFKHLAEAYLPEAHAEATARQVQLTDISPRNELDLVPDMLYETSSLPLKTLRNVAANWPYDQKASVFDAYIGERAMREHRPGSALEKAQYSWDLLSDYDAFRDVEQHHALHDLAWQTLTPRNGYDMPKLVEDAGLSDAYETAFDISLKLHSLLQQHGFALEAQYATLRGHRMRWKLTYNAREAFSLHEKVRSGGAQKLVAAMHEKLGEAHPLLAEAMQFTKPN